MALITTFEERPLEPRTLHGGVTCGYKAVTVQGTPILQLETYGSPDRKDPGTVSQSIQIDAAAAKQLLQILQAAFPGLG
jgi:hypothetical protein